MKLSVLSFVFLSCFAQDISYEISFPNAVHHEAIITLTVSNAPTGALIARMSRSSPGRYATHEFGKNVYNVGATNENNKPLAIEQIEGDVYRIEKPGKQVKISYTIFGNLVDGTYLGIDETHAHINMPATFMWVKGMEDAPVKIKFNDLEKYNWKIATQLFPTTEVSTFTAPNLQYFLDSPTELSNYKSASWKDINSDKKQQELSVIVHSNDDQSTIDGFAKMIERITRESKVVFGEFPSYDTGTYKFIYDFNTENNGDGMEHRNSTIITSGRGNTIKGMEMDLLGTFSHEFFHGWNVERIRPKTLEPFNFEHANMSNELWFAEGFTQYYGNLILKRAGLKTEKEYLSVLSRMLNEILNSPGAQKFPAIQMSRYAVFVDAGVSVDQANYQNIFASYYTYGAFIALGLDLRLRSEFNTTLDNYMQAVWKAHGKTEAPYTITDLQNILAKLTTGAFAQDFFKNYIYSCGKNDYQKLFSFAGLSLQKANQGKASFGEFRTSEENGRLKVVSATIEGTSIYEAGVDNGDYILKINDTDIKAYADISRLNNALKPGDAVTVIYEHRGNIKTSSVKMKENNTLEVTPAKTQTPAQKQFLANWLSSQIN